MNPFYAGIGSRETPADILIMMTAIARRKRLDGCILRSGGADGADKAFEMGAENKKEIFRPNDAMPKEAFDIAEKFHPAWKRCSPWARRLHARNSHIILGLDLKTPVDIVICWTEGGLGGGGTGQGIRIAAAHGIQVRDLGQPYWLEFYRKLLTTED